MGEEEQQGFKDSLPDTVRVFFSVLSCEAMSILGGGVWISFIHIFQDKKIES